MSSDLLRQLREQREKGRSISEIHVERPVPSVAPPQPTPQPQATKKREHFYNPEFDTMRHIVLSPVEAAREVCLWNDNEALPAAENVEGKNGEILRAGVKLLDEITCGRDAMDDKLMRLRYNQFKDQSKDWKPPETEEQTQALNNMCQILDQHSGSTTDSGKLIACTVDAIRKLACGYVDRPQDLQPELGCIDNGIHEITAFKARGGI